MSSRRLGGWRSQTISSAAIGSTRARPCRVREGGARDEKETLCGEGAGFREGLRGEEGDGDARRGAEAEGDAFDVFLLRGEGLGLVDCVSDGVDEADVGGGVRDVFLAEGAQGGDGGGAEAEVVVTLPVAAVVPGVLSGAGVVGCLVVVVAGRGEKILGKVVVIRVAIRVFPEGSVLEGFEEGGVFLVGEVVGGDVLRLQGEGVAEGLFPIGEGLAGDGEHEVDVDGGDSRLAEDAHGFRGLAGAVLATEGFQHVG